MSGERHAKPRHQQRPAEISIHGPPTRRCGKRRILQQLLQWCGPQPQPSPAGPSHSLGHHRFRGLAVAGIPGSQGPHQREAGLKPVCGLLSGQPLQPGLSREGLARCQAVESRHHRCRPAGRGVKPAASHGHHRLAVVRLQGGLQLSLRLSAKLQLVGIAACGRHRVEQGRGLCFHAGPGGGPLVRPQKTVGVAGENVVDHRARVAEASGGNRLPSLVELPLPEAVCGQKNAAFLIRVAADELGDALCLGVSNAARRQPRSRLRDHRNAKSPPQQADRDHAESAPGPSQRPFHAVFAQISPSFRGQHTF